MKNEKGKNSLTMYVAMIVFLLPFHRQAQVKPSKLTSQSFTRQITKTVAANYLLYLPKNFSLDTKDKYPLLLFLHGSGERGANLDFLKRVGLPKLIESGREFDCSEEFNRKRKREVREGVAKNAKEKRQTKRATFLLHPLPPLSLLCELCG